jgi:hypothetical protein
VTETSQESTETRSSGIGYAVAGVLVVIALGAATRFLESQVPQWADGTAFERVAKSIEFPVYAIVLGLIGNFVLSKLALRDALSQGFRTEFFIKTGLVLLGASINLKVLVTAAGPAIIQALLLISIVFGFTWWLVGRIDLRSQRGHRSRRRGTGQAGTARLRRVAGDCVRTAVDFPVALACRCFQSLRRRGRRMDRRQHRYHRRRRGLGCDRG